MAVRPWTTIKLLLGRFLAKSLFLTIKFIFCIFQSLSRKLSGIQDILDKNKDPSSKSVVQAVRVITSYKFCFLLPPSVRDFIYVHDEYLEPEYVLQNDGCTLMFLDPHKDLAVFTEGKPGQLLWHSDTKFRMMLALFNHPRRLILMPMSVFYKLSATLPDPKEQIIMLGNVARCGSSLLTQIFECTNEVITYNEPPALTTLGARFNKHGDTAEVRQLARCLVRMYARPVKCVPNPRAYLFKPIGPSFKVSKLIKELYPNTKVFYLYRNLDDVSKSLYKLSFTLPYLRLMYLICRSSGKLVEAIFSTGGFPTEGTNRTMDNDFCCGAFVAIVAANCYLQMHREDSEVRALLFDDILKDKEKSVRVLFKICELPESLVDDAMKAFSRDSQRGSRASREVFAKLPTLEYTMDDKVKSTELLEEFGYPPIDQPCRIEGTLDFDEAL